MCARERVASQRLRGIREFWQGIPVAGSTHIQGKNRSAGLDLHVSVNFGVADLLDLDLPAQVAANLERHGLPAAALIVEVTESAVFTDPVRIRDVLVRLDRLGVGLSLDDFGTGFSSLGHLKSLPVGEIKIDRSFVTAMATSADDSAIVNATIQLAHRLGKRVVAEGVEDQETWRLLAAAGCHVVQGYELSPPLPAQQLAPLLDRLASRRAEDPSYPTPPRPELVAQRRAAR
jgi:EAL domain-containing protein (putative c-di-GMP-specific phosphodiesterase class I)